MKTQVKLFDTTLRDGEQSPGCSMNIKEKLEVSKGLESLGVNVIEAGFPIASRDDFTAVKSIAETVRNCTIAGLSRALPKDIDCASEALKSAANSRIHTFIATSDIHLKYKLKSSREDVLAQAIKMVRYARNLCNEVQFSAEDATRTDPMFLYKILEGVIDAGATIVNIPDTTGYTTPDAFYDLIKGIQYNVKNIHKAEIAVHCHNDLGLAVANTLAAVKAGATQLECTINGIGERAGNAALEEVVMALHTRKDHYNVNTTIDSKLLYPMSRLVTKVTGSIVQSNKAIVGENAFAHESGIHQHGMLANKNTYEIMTPESVGISQNKLVLGKHSGKHAFENRLISLGYHYDSDKIAQLFVLFKDLADKKKSIDDRDIEALISDVSFDDLDVYGLDAFVINSGNRMVSTASIKLIKNGDAIEAVSKGHGPVDAAYKAIDLIIGETYKLEDYSLKAITGGEDALGEAHVKISSAYGVFNGRGVSTDVIEASIKAYLSAVNRMLFKVGI